MLADNKHQQQKLHAEAPLCGGSAEESQELNSRIVSVWKTLPPPQESRINWYGVDVPFV